MANRPVFVAMAAAFMLGTAVPVVDAGVRGKTYDCRREDPFQGHFYFSTGPIQFTEPNVFRTDFEKPGIPDQPERLGVWSETTFGNNSFWFAHTRHIGSSGWLELECYLAFQLGARITGVKFLLDYRVQDLEILTGSEITAPEGR